MITIIKGGNSAEREVSLLTAASIAESLKRQNITYSEVDAADGNWLEQVKKLLPDVVILALHGPFGEDGAIQKILEKNEIRYTGSGPEASAVTIDKLKTKEITSKKFGIATPKAYFEKGPIAYPVVVKPNKNGSSYGVSMVTEESELPQAIASAKKYDEDGSYLIEERITGVELTCGVIDLFGEITALPLVEIVPNGDFFDYMAKYNSESGCQEICPARVEEGTVRDTQEKSKRLFKELGIRQYCRVDWILRDGELYFLELNTLPGMTPTSLIIKELATEKIPYDKFIHQLIDTAK